MELTPAPLERLARRINILEDKLIAGLTPREIRVFRTLTTIHAQGNATQSTPFDVRFFLPVGAKLVRAVLQCYASAQVSVKVSNDGIYFKPLTSFSGLFSKDITSFISAYNVLRFEGNASVSCQVDLKLDTTR
jgi:hypothetical protein